METGAKAAGVTESWKRWEGQLVNGEFLLQRYVGGSSHSAVFLTERRTEPRQAAIKLIAADPQDAEKQLLRWKLATKLPHPHLLQIFEVGRCELGGAPLLYVVMEYAEEDLAQILPSRPLTPEEARGVLHAAVDVLDYLHSKGFVHGGLKPANILAAGDRVKLSSDSVCAAGELPRSAGSSCSAPELAQGVASTAADMWALGSTLVEVLTQRPPQTDSRKEAAVPRAMPEPFREIASHCLRQDPAQRWTVAQIRDYLERPASAAARPGRKVQWRYAIAAGVAVLAVIMLAGSRRHGGPSGSVPQAVRRSAGVEDKSAETPQGAGAQRTAALPETSPGQVAHQVLPQVSAQARATIQGRVRVSVKVAVDKSGNVTEATLESAGPSKYFARLALQAAREWKFVPAQSSGQPVSSQWILRFAFGRTETTVAPHPITR